MVRRRALPDLRSLLPSDTPAARRPGPALQALQALDPFDLPEWLGTAEVTWQADSPVRAGHLVVGRLSAIGEADLACDLLAIDEAHPVPVADDASRQAAHLAWRHGQVHLVTRDGRTALAGPGVTFTADGVLEAVERLARSVGADAGRWTVRLLLGGS